MIQPGEHAASGSHAGRMRAGKDPRAAAKHVLEERFRQALHESASNASPKGSNHDTTIETISERSEPQLAQATQMDRNAPIDERGDGGRHSRKEDATASLQQIGSNANAGETAPFSFEPARSGTPVVNSTQELMARFSAALQVPLAALSTGGASTFTLTVPSGANVFSAKIEKGRDGALALALALPGLSSSQKDGLARDLKLHLVQRGFDTGAVRFCDDDMQS
ncbi:MAG: hypothetical protein V2J51_12270 [Erythrobacter sp.]|nr:hypothetical protein [Erythrobacter sp.]